MTTVNVKAEHIAKGIRGDCEHCPVALAIAAAFPDIAGIAVRPEEISIKPSLDDLDWIQVRPPREVPEFVWDFDEGGTVEPFSFDLDYPAVAA